MDSYLLILILILLLYISVVYAMIQINMVSDACCDNIRESKKATVEFVNSHVKKLDKDIEDLRLFVVKKHDRDYEKLSSRIANLSFKDRSKKAPLKEISK